ncbi:MAG: exodeoxyribonuclease VII small subunit [Nitrospirae bacterium]|nr:exodeoxyribonuclease VII small subunit [Nitrospirota bacterium]
MAKSRDLTYSQALNELEKIVTEIESEEVDVDVLAEKIKRASFLITFCKGKLRTAEDEVKKVLSEMEESPAEASDEEDNGS